MDCCKQTYVGKNVESPESFMNRPIIKMYNLCFIQIGAIYINKLIISFVFNQWCEMEEWENRLLAGHMLENRHGNAWVDRNAHRANVRRRVRCEHITVDGDLLR